MPSRTRNISGLAFSDRESADCVAFETDFGERVQGLFSKVEFDTALDDPELGMPALVRVLKKRGARALRPTHRKTHGNIGLFACRGKGRALVEDHLNIGAERKLDLDRTLRRKLVPRDPSTWELKTTPASLSLRSGPSDITW